jgi:hypothetical protein
VVPPGATPRTQADNPTVDSVLMLPGLCPRGRPRGPLRGVRQRTAIGSEVGWVVTMAERAYVVVWAGAMAGWVGRGSTRRSTASSWVSACVLGVAPGGPLRGLRQRSSRIPGGGTGRGHGPSARHDGAGPWTDESEGGGSPGEWEAAARYAVASIGGRREPERCGREGRRKSGVGHPNLAVVP